MMNYVTGSVGHRLGPELKRLVPLCLKHCAKAKVDGDIELIENSLQVAPPPLLQPRSPCPSRARSFPMSHLVCSIDLLQYRYVAVAISICSGRNIDM